MCELLGMDCNTPTDIVFSFTALASRGGRTGPHGDGWGIAFFDGAAARLFLEPRACASSPLAAFLRQNAIKTLQAVAHVRRQTRGTVRLANTHPFVRELWGRSWVFAHNGTLRGARALPLDRFTPIGQTDSERAFCHLLGALQAEFPRNPPGPPELWQAVAEVAGRIARLGTFNFLLGNGQFLFARCDTLLHHIVRQAPFGKATLRDEDVTVDFSAVTTPRDRVAVIATTPLTRNEVWTPGRPATLWVFRHGRLQATLDSGVPRRRRPPARRSG